jgi:methyl-accepting chemotaxis protein
VRRLAAQHPNHPAADALSEAGARLSEHGNAFVGLLCNGQLDQAQQLSQRLESDREALVTQLAALLAEA